MTKFLLKLAVVSISLTANAAAQITGVVQIYTVPSGIGYTVDGAFYRVPSTAVWSPGSKHVLSLNPVQEALNIKTRWAFNSWNYAGGVLPGVTVTVTADPALKEYYATFGVEHAISLNFATCTPEAPCQSPGTISVNGTLYKSDADVYLAAGSLATMIATPAPGYIFTGWDPGVNQTITGFVNTVLVAGPTVVRPRFRLARRINLETVPPELELFADRARVPTPSTFDWGYGTSHSIGAPSPQVSKYGSQWVFSQWSDGGAVTHDYLVGDGGQVTLTATFVRGTGTELTTSPAGLQLKIDGRDNWPAYFFTWPAGEVHRIEAPEQQTDERGRLWNFSSWSNGGPRVQDYVAADGPTGAARLVATYTPEGHMVVSSAMGGIAVKVDGAECATPCDVHRPVGTVVRVSAPASVALGDSTRADFDGWPGSGSASADWAVTLGGDPVTPCLTYHRMNRLIVGSNPADAVSWRMQPASADGFYDTQTAVIVSATALNGFRFRAWSGDASGGTPTTTVLMNAPRQVEALVDRVPYIAPAGVANAAGSTPEPGVAPGSIVSIFGTSFAPDVVAGPQSPLTQTLGGVTVKAGDRILPLFFVSPSQINVQLPDDMPSGDQRLTVSSLGLPDIDATFTVVRNAPGLFQGEHASAVAAHEDGSPVTVDAPAKSGELVTLYGTGFGPTERGRPFGFAPATASAIVDTAMLQIAGTAVPALSPVAVAGRVGIDSVQFRVSDGLSGSVSVRVTVNGKDSNVVLVAVQ